MIDVALKLTREELFLLHDSLIECRSNLGQIPKSKSNYAESQLQISQINSLLVKIR